MQVSLQHAATAVFSGQNVFAFDKVQLCSSLRAFQASAEWIHWSEEISSLHRLLNLQIHPAFSGSTTPRFSQGRL